MTEGWRLLGRTLLVMAVAIGIGLIGGLLGGA